PYPSARRTVRPETSRNDTMGDPILARAVMAGAPPPGVLFRVPRGRALGRDPDGDSFRIAQGDLLGHELADHQGEISDDGHDEADADRLGDRHAQTQIKEPFGETLTERGSGKRAGED